MRFLTAIIFSLMVSSCNSQPHCSNTDHYKELDSSYTWYKLNETAAGMGTVQYLGVVQIKQNDYLLINAKFIKNPKTVKYCSYVIISRYGYYSKVRTMDIINLNTDGIIFKRIGDE